MSIRRNTRPFIFVLVMLLSAGSLVFASVTPRAASAQTPEDSWTIPLNLSHTGATTNPALISDSDGVMHVVWQDGFEQFIYSQFVEGEWSPPAQTSLSILFARLATVEADPESEETLNIAPNPLFISSPGGFIYAVWLNSQGALYASRVSNSSFQDLPRWGLPRIISYVAVTFTATVDVNGDLHVAYMKKADVAATPAGIYYTRTTGSGNSWVSESFIYETPYFNTLEQGDVNLSIATGGTVESPFVFITWDNRPRKQLLVSKSTDGGVTWQAPAQIAGPSRSTGVSGPFNVRVNARNNEVMLVWQSGEPDGVCTQFFGFSDDAGASWSGPQKMIEGQPGCARSNEFVSYPAANLTSPLLLRTNIRDQIYLSAWNGKEWSEPQLQPMLSIFEDPEIFNQVDMDCLQTLLVGNQLYAVGCDKSTGGDIWLTARQIGNITSWFSSHDWSPLTPLASDNLKLSTMDMVATQDGLIHALFNQASDPSIFYTRWDGTVWSRISLAWKVPELEASWLAASASPDNELFVIARSRRGALYFSRAKSAEAVNPSGWSEPVHIETSHDGRLSPMEVGWDAAGTIYIAYSIPVNDERGVYLIQSQDRGETWSEAAQVFDGVEAGYESVGAPTLSVSPNGSLALAWKQQAVQVEGVPQTLSVDVAISEDGGRSFDVNQRVVEAPVSWHEIGHDKEGNIHFFYRRSDNPASLWDQVSSDSGLTWQDPLTFQVDETSAAVFKDPNDRLHLVESGLKVLHHWLWDGSRWQAQASARWSLNPPVEGQVERLAASINVNGKMAVLQAALPNTGTEGERLLFSAVRTIDLPAREIEPQPTATRALPTPTSTPATTPTVASASLNLQNPSAQSEPDNLVTFAMILLPVSFLLLNVIGIVTYRVIRSRNR